MPNPKEGGEIIEKGLCWSLSTNPTIDDAHIVDVSTIGTQLIVTGLEPATVYYVRAYATNAVGTAYGEGKLVTTTNNYDGELCPGTPTVTDVDGNTYNTVKIGEQCWMAENLRTTKYADNSLIYQGSGNSTTMGYWYYPNGNPSNKQTYGLLYNWKAVMHGATSSNSIPSGVQGICPSGWHVPSDAEWYQLTNYLESQSIYHCGGNNNWIAKSISSKTGWSTSQNPTISDNHTLDNADSTIFVSVLSDLIAGTTYYVRAYATNNVGTSYGENKMFTTTITDSLITPTGDGQPCPGTPTITDFDGNIYNTVQIGDQCWMKENMRTTHYADGTPIDLTNSNVWWDSANYHLPNNDTSNVAEYGYLYSYQQVMHNSPGSSCNPSGVQGLCPVGWHVPSKAEWSQLHNYVSGHGEYLCNGTSIDKSLCATAGWIYDTSSNYSPIWCAPGYNMETNNATGFSALPAGRRSLDFGENVNFWTSEPYVLEEGGMMTYYLVFSISSWNQFDYSSFNNNESNWDGDYSSLRCLRD